MKKLAAGGFAVLGILLLAAEGNAADTLSPPLQGAQIKLHSFTRGPDGPNGGFQIDVGVENLGSETVKLGVEAHAVGAPGNVRQTMEVSPRAVKHFVFPDWTGGPPICTLASSKEYTISFGDSTASAEVHKAIFHASQCSVSATMRNDWSTQPYEYMKGMSLYADNVFILEQPTCDKAVKARVMVFNHTMVAQNGLRVLAKDGSTTLAASPTFNLEKAAYTPITLSFSATTTAPVKLVLEGGTQVKDGGLFVKYNASCSYSAELDPKVAPTPPRVIPR